MKNTFHHFIFVKNNRFEEPIFIDFELFQTMSLNF